MTANEDREIAKLLHSFQANLRGASPHQGLVYAIELLPHITMLTASVGEAADLLAESYSAAFRRETAINLFGALVSVVGLPGQTKPVNEPDIAIGLICTISAVKRCYDRANKGKA
ncbi:MAG: hypothetical protein ACNA8W_19170, partial [Bradymonadaceae bacterium]